MLNPSIKACWRQLDFTLAEVSNLACSKGSKKMVELPEKLLFLPFSIMSVAKCQIKEIYAKKLKIQPKRRHFLHLAPLRQIPQDFTSEIQKDISGIHAASSSLSKKTIYSTICLKYISHLSNVHYNQYFYECRHKLLKKHSSYLLK